MVLEVATTASGSELTGYLAVEISQLSVAIATALLAIWLVNRGALPLSSDAKAAYSADSG
jgi:hypothetical protein